VRTIARKRRPRPSRTPRVSRIARRDELARRADRLFARRLKQASITVVKTLADFDWSFNAKIPIDVITTSTSNRSA
jgi:hypothetical protein